MQKVPTWIIEGYKKEIKSIELHIEALRKEGLFGLVPEHVGMLNSLKHTLSDLVEQ